MNLTPPTPDALYETLAEGTIETVIQNFLSCPFTGRRYGPDIVGASKDGYLAWASAQGKPEALAASGWDALMQQLNTGPQ